MIDRINDLIKWLTCISLLSFPCLGKYLHVACTTHHPPSTTTQNPRKRKKKLYVAFDVPKKGQCISLLLCPFLVLFCFNDHLELRFEDMEYQLRKRMFKKRIVRRLTFSIVNGLSIEVNTYALVRSLVPGRIIIRIYIFYLFLKQTVIYTGW